MIARFYQHLVVGLLPTELLDALSEVYDESTENVSLRLGNGSSRVDECLDNSIHLIGDWLDAARKAGWSHPWDRLAQDIETTYGIKGDE